MQSSQHHGANSSVLYAQSSLPILFQGDAVVVGGSFGGVAAALVLAAAGRSVALVEPRTYLGREMTATMRPWLWLPTSEMPVTLPQPLAACFASAYADNADEETGEQSPGSGQADHSSTRWVFRLDAVKKSLEDLLLDAGVQLLYASLPVALDRSADNHTVVIGNKSGRQALLASIVIDATETALLARLANTPFEDPAQETATYACTIEFTRINDTATDVTPHTLFVPDDLGLLDNQAVLHRGYRDDGHYWVECRLQRPRKVETPLALAQREIEGRTVAFNTATHLIAENPLFAEASLTGISYELAGPSCTHLAGPSPSWSKHFHSFRDETGITIAAFAGPMPDLWCLNEAARLPDSARMSDPLFSGRMGAWLGEVLAKHTSMTSEDNEQAQTQDSPDITSNGASDVTAASHVSIGEPDTPQRGRTYVRAEVSAFAVPIQQQTDVLVVGGGTSGATAAITAAQHDLSTVLVEMNPGLGGTGTYGGIHSYWFGRRVGFAARLSEWVDELHDRLHHSRQSGPIPSWNIEAKIQALLNAADAAGVAMVLNSLFVGSIIEYCNKEGKQTTVVRGVVAATRLGPVAFMGQVVIDASGDGDVAAFAGAGYVYGSERDHAIMYTYMAQVAKPGAPRNVKTSMVDVSNVKDYTRAILEERRRGRDSDHDHGIYMAPRESRHIRADVVLTLTDQLVRRCWPDVVNVAFSNNDIKGQASSHWVLIGLISPHLAIEIPYRALLPQGLDNIIVAGKAFSATHDALGAPRMQSDIENLGGVAALAAELAIRSRNSLRNIDIRALQQRLVEAGVLPPVVLTRSIRPLPRTGAELQATVDAITAGHPLHAYSDMELNEPFLERIPLVDALCAGPEVIPLLEQELQKSSNASRRIRLAQALAMVGSQAGVLTLIEAIESELAGDTLPNRDSHIRHVGYPPDQGAAPDVAYLIHALGLTGDRRALPIWQRVVDLLASATEEEVVDKLYNRYYYVSSVCFGAERLGDPDAIPILKQLHSYPAFQHHVMEKGFEPDYFRERIAFLEVVIGRALARCGSPEGYVTLITYLNDARALLAEHAHTELKSISGQDFGKDMAAWSQWLEDEADALQPRPWQGSTDPVQAWDEVIYVAADREQELIVGEAT